MRIASIGTTLVSLVFTGPATAQNAREKKLAETF
jgi:hypothetical protein